jgi:hypothetical protein
LRSVCATDVFVGHAGSRSFRREKAILVSRNFGVLGKTFPRYPFECVAFMAKDPLRPARAAIELAMPVRTGPVLLVTGSGALIAVARARARRLATLNHWVLICEIGHRSAGLTAAVSAADGGAPQSMAFTIDRKTGRDRLLAFIAASKPSRIEFVDPANTPHDLARVLCGIGVPHDILIADAGLFEPGRDAPVPVISLRLDYVRPETGGRRIAPSAVGRLKRSWTGIVESADRILAPGEQAAAFANRFLPRKIACKLDVSAAGAKVARRRAAKGAGRLGIIPTRTSALELHYIREIASRRMMTGGSAIRIAVLGETLDDLMLMRFGNVFVSGAVNPADLKRLTRQYRINAVFTGFGAPLFGHPLGDGAMQCGVPTAYIDWSFGSCRPFDRDLPIDPSLSPRQAAAALAYWAEAQCNQLHKSGTELAELGSTIIRSSPRKRKSRATCSDPCVGDLDRRARGD